MRLTNYFIRKKIKALAEQSRKRTRRFCALDEARRILVLYNADDKEMVAPFLRTLSELGKQVHACVYIPDNIIAEEPHSYMRIQGKTDLDMWYMPKDPVCKEFNSLQADILIDLTRGDNFVMHYLLLQHPCSFKVGAKNEDTDMYDFSISMTNGDNIQHLSEQILFYLRSIRSK